MGRTLIVLVLLCLMVTSAQAMCRDDLRDIGPRIDRLKNTDIQRYWIAHQWYFKAETAERGSEADCVTYYEKARKALTLPLVEVKNCIGPNAYLPECRANLASGAGGPLQTTTGAEFGGRGGGGGGGGGGGRPTAQFTPPPVSTAPAAGSSSGSSSSSSAR
jgi:hypothetical protein